VLCNNIQDTPSPMKKILFLLLFICLTAVWTFSIHSRNASGAVNPESLEGMTHYGMPIDEVKKSYKKNDAILEIIYSKSLSDDNMDEYVLRFYNELLNQIEKWLYTNALPVKNMKIVISNCKFCKVGYCKKKNIKEVRLVSYKNDMRDKQTAFTHFELLDRTKYIELAQSVVTVLLSK
jgi:hypothetical protein